MQMQRKFLPGAVLKDDTLNDRQIRVVVSTPTPDRVKDVMEPTGCNVTNYKLNPVVLADHNVKTPIGTAAIEVKSERVEAVITFAPQGISEKADEYCGLSKAGIINTVSPGFREIDTTPIKGGGTHVKSWELLELSLVAVPAQPEALVIARSLEKADGENWKVGASRNLPLGDDSAWDGPAAEASIFDEAGFDGDGPDTKLARKGFLVYDASSADKKGSYKLPFAKVIDGRLTAMPSGIRAAASRLPQADIPDDVAEKARAVLDSYEAKMKDKEGGDGKSARVARTKEAAPRIKGLYDVAQLAYLLDQLGWLQGCSEWEAEMEGDGSKVPAMLSAALRSVADALLAMTAEEIAELMAGKLDDDDDDGADGVIVTSALSGLVTKGLKSRFAKALAIAAKSGRKFSAETEKMLNEHCDGLDAHADTMKECAKGLKAKAQAVRDMVAEGQDDDSDTDDEDTSDEPNKPDTGKAAADVLSKRQRQVELKRRQAA